jgi:probable HAF family extracellular repeat protein
MPQRSYSYTLIDPPFSPGGPGTRSVSISQINDLGQVLGTVYRQGTGYRAGITAAEPFLYDNGKYTVLDAPGASSTTARQLNNTGQVIGSYQDGAGISHSFVYQDGRYQDITVPGAAFTTVVQSSGDGKLLGTFFDSSGVHPFVDDNGKDMVLNVPTPARSSVAIQTARAAIHSSMPMGTILRWRRPGRRAQT